MRRILAAALVALAPLAAALAAPRAALAEPVPLAQLSAYLNGLAELETAFTQENADGSLSQGRIFLHRPGRLRLEYDPPDQAVVIASGGTVAIFDAKSNEPPEQYPLSRTPLSLILAPRIDLAQARMVVDWAEVEGQTHVLAQDPKNPEYGTLELVFDPAPLRLVGWIVTDDMGNQTVVRLGEFVTRQSLPTTLFSIEQEQRRRARG